MKGKSIRIIENRRGLTDPTARFSLSFPSLSPEAAAAVCPAMLAQGGCGAGLLIELDPSLLEGPREKMDAALSAFEACIHTLQAPMQASLVSVRPQTTLFGMLTSPPARKVRLVRALLSESQWRELAARMRLPGCGTRYFILREAMDPQKLFDEMDLLTEAQLRSLFLYSLFDRGESGQAGLDSEVLTLDMVKAWAKEIPVY